MNKNIFKLSFSVRFAQFTSFGHFEVFDFFLDCLLDCIFDNLRKQNPVNNSMYTLICYPVNIFVFIIYYLSFVILINLLFTIFIIYYL